MSLADLANVAEIFGVLAIIFGIVFGLIQLRQHREQTRKMSIMELAASFEDREFSEAYRLIADLDAGTSADELTAMGDEYLSAALRVGLKFEIVGLLVFHRIVPVDATTDLIGGAAVKFWGILEHWIVDTRTKHNHDSLFEWFQWLAERLKERGAEADVPAYKAHKVWRDFD